MTTTRKYTLQSEHSVVPQTLKMLVRDLKRKKKKRRGKKNKQTEKRPHLCIIWRLRREGTFFPQSTKVLFVSRSFSCRTEVLPAIQWTRLAQKTEEHNQVERNKQGVLVSPTNQLNILSLMSVSLKRHHSCISYDALIFFSLKVNYRLINTSENISENIKGTSFPSCGYWKVYCRKEERWQNQFLFAKCTGARTRATGTTDTRR